MRHGKICKRGRCCHPFSFFRPQYLKKRPALVIADLKGDDFILCQITSAVRNDEYAVPLTSADFEEGSLPAEKSLIRTNKIFAADISHILYRSGSLKPQKIREVEEKLTEIFTK